MIGQQNLALVLMGFALAWGTVGNAAIDPAVNPGVRATAEQAEKAFKDHENVHPSFAKLKSGKSLAEAWKNLRHELLKGGEENEKRRELIGRILLIAETDDGVLMRRFADAFVTLYGEKLDLKKTDKILANVHRMAVENEKVPNSLTMGISSTGLVERAFGNWKPNKELDPILDSLVARCKGEADWDFKKK